MKDKNPWNGYGKPSFHIINLSNMLTTWIRRLALASPLQQCWDEETLLGQGKVYRGAQTTTLLGGEGKGGKIKADRVNCLKNFVLHCCYS